MHTVRATRPPDLSVVIPMYREARRIAATLEDACATLAEGPRRAEVVLVDDGSDDATLEVVRPFVESSARGNLLRVRLVRHETNKGKGAAVRTGLAEAGGRWRLIMDADNSCRVGEVERLFAALGRGRGGGGAGGKDNRAVAPPIALVCGSRRAPGAEVERGAGRSAASGLFRLALRVLGLALLEDTQCGFKLYRADLASVVARAGREDRFAFDLEHLLIARRCGVPALEVGVRWRHFDGGTVRPLRDGAHMLWRGAHIRLRGLLGRYDLARLGPGEPGLSTRAGGAGDAEEDGAATPAAGFVEARPLESGAGVGRGTVS